MASTRNFDDVAQQYTEGGAAERWFYNDGPVRPGEQGAGTMVDEAPNARAARLARIAAREADYRARGLL